MIRTAEFRSLGTGVTVLTTNEQSLQGAVQAVEQVLTRIDETCSRFREDSEISQLNRSAGRRVSVSPLLFQALETAVRVCRMTAGAVDPTVGKAMRIIGYDRDFAGLTGEHAFQVTVRPVPGCDRLTLDPLSVTARIDADVELDLGASAKALAADLAASAAHAASGGGVLVSLGGDIAIAGQPPDDGWPILVSEDHAAPLDGPGDVVALKVGALATSSTTVRRWRQGEVDRHHIIDPTTGAPAHVHWRTASVLAASCVDANAAATASIVWGKAAPGWLRRHRLPARLVSADGAVTYLNGWPSRRQVVG